MAALIAVYGLFMTPLGWGWGAFVWGYALVWFLLNDRIKVLAYRIFDPVKTEAKSKAKAEAKPEADAVNPINLSPAIAKRAYALYEEGGRKDGEALQDWQKAESEIQN